MFPISISQLKSLNFKKLLKIILWYFLRNFQLKNNKTYKSIFFVGKTESSLSNIKIQLQEVNKPNKLTLIIFENFSFKIFFKYIKYIKNMRILDKNYLLTTEASTRFRIHYFDICDDNQKAKYLELSINNFSSIKNKISGDEIGLLGTGPTFETGKEIFSKKRLSIITCNSAIYDDHLWENHDSILTFADPVFHFGKSEEAERFKNEVIKKFKKYKFYIVIPMPAFPILHLDWGIDENYIIGINSRDGNLKYPLIDENLTTNRTSNVLTEFMLPFTTNLTKKINLAGFDGRVISEKNFWQYSNTTEQNLESHKLNHPSFFDDRNIDNYYKKHISILEKQIMLLEKKDYIISNKTISNIEFLNKRIHE